MGIPYYFSYLVKNHGNLLVKYTTTAPCEMTTTTNTTTNTNTAFKVVNHLFLDSNSIIYDMVRSIDPSVPLTDTLYGSIIHRVIQQIEAYITLLRPQGIVMVAFDGVAPVAKLNQQRERRYKSWYQAELTRSIQKNGSATTADAFHTAAITPGTPFMEELNTRIHKHFEEFNDRIRIRNRNNTNNNNNNNNNNKTKQQQHPQEVIVSGSDEYGEGEHKLFAFLRDTANPQHPHYQRIRPDESVFVYGLDADLIMLSLNHLPLFPNIYLFRETPDFVQSLDRDLEPNAHYYLDIPALSLVIADEMNGRLSSYHQTPPSQSQSPSPVPVHEYIFLCFFLGNDFLPHFPALNIRTGGIHKLLQTYQSTIGEKGKYFLDTTTTTSTTSIRWNDIRAWLTVLANQEETYLVEEAKQRAKKSRQQYPERTEEEILRKLDMLPMVDRSLEVYIQPGTPGWQERYYRALFDWDKPPDEATLADLCRNYLEGLEWTFAYYTHGCIDWRWSYRFAYPPLLQDLVRFVPVVPSAHAKTSHHRSSRPLLQSYPPRPVTPYVQLSYVLPHNALFLLPPALKQALLTKHPEWYRTDCEFLWAFCKYFWEAHALLEPIDLDELEVFVDSVMKPSKSIIQQKPSIIQPSKNHKKNI
jgi:5'-3' exoribonuclease 1